MLAEFHNFFLTQGPTEILEIIKVLSHGGKFGKERKRMKKHTYIGT